MLAAWSSVVRSADAFFERGIESFEFDGLGDGGVAEFSELCEDFAEAFVGGSECGNIGDDHDGGGIGWGIEAVDGDGDLHGLFGGGRAFGGAVCFQFQMEIGVGVGGC